MEIQIFTNEEFGEIRTVIKNGEIWFVAADVCKVLDIKNVSQALEDFETNEKADISIGYTSSNGVVQNRNVLIINEPGLYRLIFKSRKPDAKKFQHWIYHEVIPSIRKTGSYSMSQKTSEPATDAFKDVRSLATAIQEEFIGVQRSIALAQAIDIAEKVHNVPLQSLKSLLPPAEHDTGYLNPTRIGQKLGGIPAQEVNKILAQKGFQYKDNKDWRLTELGKNYGEEMPYTRNNHSGYQIRWNEEILKVLSV